MYLQNRNRLKDIENRPVVAKRDGVTEQRVSGGGMDRELGLAEWVNSKARRYSTGKYIQYPVINHNGKEYKKEVYTCITQSLSLTAEIGTTL